MSEYRRALSNSAGRLASVLAAAACALTSLPVAALAAGGTAAGYLQPATHFARLAADEGEDMKAAAATYPSDTVEIGVLPTYAYDLGGWALFSNETCVETGHGKYVTKTAPKYGKITTKLVSGTVAGGPCEGAKGEFLVAYYTWTNNKTTATQDFFDIEWEANSSSCVNDCNINENFLAVKGPRIFFYQVADDEYADITSAQRTVAIGQLVGLSSEPVIAGQTPSWSVPGTTIGGYSPTAKAYATGKTTPTDFKSDDTVFHWLDAANGRVVTYTDKISSSHTVTARTTFNVVGPTGVKVTEKVGKVQLVGGTTLSFGSSSTPGVALTATATEPAGYARPEFVWVRIQGMDTIDETINKTTETCTFGLGLDAVFPYATGPSASETPSLALPSAASEVKLADADNFYLMWWSNVARSIPVPLGVVPTSWSGTAVQNAKTHAWTLSSPKGTASAFATRKVFPVWTKVVSTGAPSCN